MDKGYHFQSVLAPFITGLLDEKRSLGFDYHTEELTLIRFDKYCVRKGPEQVSALLGHSQIETTRSHYASPSPEQMKEAVEKGSIQEPEQKPESMRKARC